MELNEIKNAIYADNNKLTTYFFLIHCAHHMQVEKFDQYMVWNVDLNMKYLGI
mgnify:CR=1 FL=1